MTRIAISDFNLANPLYIAKAVSFFTVSASGQKTTTLATLYAGPNGTEQAANPQVLDSEGKLEAPIYIEEPVIAAINELSSGTVETGVILVSGRNRGSYQLGKVYFPSEITQYAQTGDKDKNWYYVEELHTATDFEADLAAGKLSLLIDTKNVEAEADRSKTEADRSKTEADRSNAEADRSQGFAIDAQTVANNLAGVTIGAGKVEDDVTSGPIAPQSGYEYHVYPTANLIDFNMPSINVEGEPFECTVVFKAGSYPVNIKPNGTDTIDGVAGDYIIQQPGIYTFKSNDLENPDVDNWVVSKLSGLIARHFKNTFVEGTDFNEGSNFTLTLSESVPDKNALRIVVGGVIELDLGTHFTLSGNVVTITATYEAGMGDIVATYTEVYPSTFTPDDSIEGKHVKDKAIEQRHLADDVGLGRRNLTVNPVFTMNQRGQASGVALGAGAFGHDQWHAGGTGCTYTFVANEAGTEIDVTAGHIRQAIDGANIQAVTYVLSWAGTAQGRIVAGTSDTSGAALADSPVTVIASKGQKLVMEFSGGTLTDVQVEEGDTPTPFDRWTKAEYQADCAYYVQKVKPYFFLGYSTSGNNNYAPLVWSPMRAQPTATVIENHSIANATNYGINPTDNMSGYLHYQATATGNAGVYFSALLSAELT